MRHYQCSLMVPFKVNYPYVVINFVVGDGLKKCYSRWMA